MLGNGKRVLNTAELVYMCLWGSVSSNINYHPLPSLIGMCKCTRSKHFGQWMVHSLYVQVMRTMHFGTMQIEHRTLQKSITRGTWMPYCHAEVLPTNMLAFSGVSKLSMNCTFLWMNREHALFIYNRSASDITKLYPAFLFAAIGWLNPNPIHVGFHIPILCVEYKVVLPKVTMNISTINPTGIAVINQLSQVWA